MNPLRPISISAPGFYGLNKQSSAAAIDEKWAIEADNCVFDDTGRVGARKGWSKVTASAISGTPDIEQIFEYINSSNQTQIITAANSKLYKGTTTLTEITGSVTITDDNWKFQNFNGNMVGFQDSHDPIIYKGTGNATKLLLEATAWQASTPYSLGDIVRATSDDNRYYECTTAGTSDSSEPTWDTDVGDTTADNTATWTTRMIPQSDEVLAAFGRVWVTDGTVISYSDLLIPYNFDSGSGGTLDMKGVWVYGMDSIVAVHAFNGHLVIFGNHNITIYSGPDDPSTMSLVEQINGVGCIARDSIQNTGTDILFLSDTGVRSLQRTIQEKSMPLNDVSKNNRDFLLTYALSETKNLIRSVYHQPEGFYLLTFPTTGVTFCFDTRRRLQDGSYRTTTWSGINPSSMCTSRDNSLYIGKEGVVGKYDGYDDNGSSYSMFYRSSWLGLNEQRLKIPKKIRSTVAGGYGYTINYHWAFDYLDDGYVASAVRPTADVAEYNVAEYNIAEYSGGSTLATIPAQMSRSGEVIQFGWSVGVNGEPISFQKVDVYYKLGRLNR